VDGRFRVACACRALLHGLPSSFLLIHDFERIQYHAILEVADQIGQVGNLAMLRRRSEASDARIWALYEAANRDPS